MKKTVLFFLFCFATLSAFAEIGFGFRAKVAVGVGTKIEDEFLDAVEKMYGPITVNKLWGGGFDFYANFSLGGERLRFGLQPELGFTFYNGTECIKKGIKDTVYYSTFDVPILFTMKARFNDRFSMTVGAGAQLSVPFRAREKMETKGWFGTIYDWEEYGIKMHGVEFGAVADINFNIAAKMGELAFGLRYLCNFNKTQIESFGHTMDFLTRRALHIEAGYHFLF